MLRSSFEEYFEVKYNSSSSNKTNISWKVKYRIEKSSFLEIYEDLNDIKENKEFDHVYVENNKVKNDVEKVINVMKVTIKL